MTDPLGNVDAVPMGSALCQSLETQKQTGHTVPAAFGGEEMEASKEHMDHASWQLVRHSKGSLACHREWRRTPRLGAQGPITDRLSPTQDFPLVNAGSYPAMSIYHILFIHSSISDIQEGSFSFDFLRKHDPTYPKHLK